MSETALSENRTRTHPSHQIRYFIQLSFHPSRPAFHPRQGRRQALPRCLAARIDAYMRKNKSESAAEYSAADEGREAYRNAMPLLVDYEGIRAFLACLSHGILIGAIPIEMDGQLRLRRAGRSRHYLRGMSKSSAS